MRSGPTKVGSEVLVGEPADRGSFWPALSVLSNEDIVTAWLNIQGGSAPSIKIRVAVGQDGQLVRESEVCLFSHRHSDIYRDIAVTALAFGSFIVSWSCHSYQTDAEWAVVQMAQAFDAAARPQSGVFVVDADRVGLSKRCGMTPLSEGGCVAVWSDERRKRGSDIRAALVTPDTEGMLSPAQALPTIDLKCSDPGRAADRPVVSATPGGGFLVLWREGGIAPSAEDVLKGRLFDAAAWPQGPEFLVEASRGRGPRSGAVVNPALAVLPDSRFVVSWIESRPGVGSAQPEIDLLARIFTAAGRPQGEAFLVRSSFDPLIDSNSVVALAGGGFAIAWEVHSADASVRVRAQVFSASGFPIGTELACAGSGIDPRLHALADGGFLMSWSAVDGIRVKNVRVASSAEPDHGLSPVPASEAGSDRGGMG